MTLKEVARNFAAGIVRDIATKHNLQPSDLRKPGRFAHIVSARREAMVELSAAGFSLHQIAAFLEVDPSTVDYHINPVRKARLSSERRVVSA